MTGRTTENKRATHVLRIALIAGAALTTSAYAEDLYVIETLVVGVATAPDSTAEKIGSIRSGDRVELLERQSEYVRVRLQSGAEGWVKSSYLSAEPPLKQRLDERTQELEQAREQVARLETELAEARAATVTAQSAPAAPVASDRTSLPLATAAAAELERGPASPQSRGKDLNVSQNQPDVWVWTLASAVIALIAGFALGWRMLDRRIRRKYGGLRIY